MNFKLRLLLFAQNYIEKKADFSTLSAVDFRKANEKQNNKLKKLIDYPAIEMQEIKDQQIVVRDGASIPIRIYRPSDHKDRPVFVFFHGGGFVTRTIDSHDKACRRLAKVNDIIVVSVGYRLAPEFKFPIPHQDCYDATVWAAEHAKNLGGNPNKIIVGGDSAGGNLATVVALLARDLNGPKIAYQVLIYPTTDARMGFPSIDAYGKKYFLTKDMMHWFIENYCRTKEDILNPLMSPYLMENLRDLPPAFVCTAQYDPLKDEGEAYAKRLRAAGNQVVFKEYKGVIHGFFNIPKITPTETKELHEDIKKTLSAL